MNTQKITIKELSSKLEAINPHGKKRVHKDRANLPALYTIRRRDK